MIIQSPETEMPEPYKTYVRQRSASIADVLGRVVGGESVQLCPRAIVDEERIVDEQALVYGVIVNSMRDGYKTALYDDDRNSREMGIATNDAEEAHAYTLHQLELGNRVRVKDPKESDGNGQYVISSSEELTDVFDRLNGGSELGVVLMPHLDSIDYRISVGLIDLGKFGRFAYVGNEATTHHLGSEVYGGTQIGLCRVNGVQRQSELARLLDVPEELVGMGVGALRRYKDTVKHLGRASVDVVQGTTDNGTVIKSVIDITPRVGGVTPAEVLAISEVQGAPKAICIATSRLLYNPRQSPSTGYNFVDTDDLVINAAVDEVRE